MFGLKVSNPDISINLFLFTTLLSEIMLTILNLEFVTLVITCNINFDSSTDDIYFVQVLIKLRPYFWRLLMKS